MGVAKPRRFVYGYLGWLFASMLLLALVSFLSYELFFISALIGFLVVFELSAPVRTTPTWRRRLWWVTVLGMIGFGYVVVRRVLELIPVGGI